MVKKEHQMICQKISKVSSYIRFVGVVSSDGKLLAYYRRPNFKPLLDAKKTQYQFKNLAISTGLDAAFDKSLGKVEFVWEERKKVQILSFAVKKNRVWVSLDKKVVRSEILRSIDECLPIVKHYS